MRGFNVEAYTGETGERREQLEQALLDNRVKALVATTALGMGYDKPDLCVRDSLPDAGIGCRLLPASGPGGSCTGIGLRHAAQRPGRDPISRIGSFGVRSRRRMRSLTVLSALERAQRMACLFPNCSSRVNLSKGRIEKTIALLSLEAPAPIAKQGTKWQLTAANLSDDFWERAERLTALATRRASANAGLCRLAVRPAHGLPDQRAGRRSEFRHSSRRLPACRPTVNEELVNEAVHFCGEPVFPSSLAKCGRWRDAAIWRSRPNR